MDLSVAVGGKPRYAARDTILYGTSPAQLLERHFDVTRGFVCSSDQDVWAVGGFKTDLTKGKYWRVSVNGSYADVSAWATVLRDGDAVAWEYIDGSL